MLSSLAGTGPADRGSLGCVCVRGGRGALASLTIPPTWLGALRTPQLRQGCVPKRWRGLCLSTQDTRNQAAHRQKSWRPRRRPRHTINDAPATKSQAAQDARAEGRAAAHEALPKTEAIGEDETHCPAPRNDCEAPSSLRYTSQDTESAATSGDRYEQNLASSRHLGPRCQCPGYAAACRRAGTNSWPVVAQRGPRTDGSACPFDSGGASAYAVPSPKQHDRQSQRCDQCQQCQQPRAVPGHAACNNAGGGSVWRIGSDC